MEKNFEKPFLLSFCHCLNTFDLFTFCWMHFFLSSVVERPARRETMKKPTDGPSCVGIVRRQKWLVQDGSLSSKTRTHSPTKRNLETSLQCRRYPYYEWKKIVRLSNFMQNHLFPIMKQMKRLHHCREPLISIFFRISGCSLFSETGPLPLWKVDAGNRTLGFILIGTNPLTPWWYEWVWRVGVAGTTRRKN